MLVGNEAARLYLQTRNDPAESARMVTAATAAHVPWLAPTYAATSPLQKPTRLHRATLWTRERRGLLAWMPRRGRGGGALVPGPESPHVTAFRPCRHALHR